MQVTVTNLTSDETLFLTSAYKQLAPGAAVTFRRSPTDLSDAVDLRKLMLAGKVSITTVKEDGDADFLPLYTDATRPLPTAVPAGTEIFNTGDNFQNVSDGTNWRNPAGAIT